jgi:hypothetical protein
MPSSCHSSRSGATTSLDAEEEQAGLGGKQRARKRDAPGAACRSDDLRHSLLEISIKDEPVARAVLYHHLSRSPFLVLQTGSVVFLRARLQLGMKCFQVVDANADARARTAIAVVLAQVNDAFSAGDLHVEGVPGSKRCAKSTLKQSQSM